MKTAFAFFSLLFFTLASLQQVSLFGIYLLNKDGITAKFCVNKDKPEMKCNGKCHMKDVLANTAKDKEEKSLSLETQFIVLAYFQKHTIVLPLFFQKNNFLQLSKKLNSSYFSSLFRPPPSYV